MAQLFLQIISTLLLFGGALLLLFWKKEGKIPGDKLIRRIGMSVALIGFYTLGTVIIGTLELNLYTFGLISLPTLGGMVLLLFSLLNYLEVGK